MRLPSGYNARLARFDRDLRLRWSPRRHIWLLERRARYQRLPVDPARYGSQEHDTLVQMRDGYFTLGQYQPHDLPRVDRLIEELRRTDSRRRGTQNLDALANAIADELDAAELAREERARQAALRDVRDRAADYWETDRWRRGERVGGALSRITLAR